MSERDGGTGEGCTCPDDDCRETCPVCIDLPDEAPCASRASTSASEVEAEDDGPECSNCGKTTCSDADLPEFTEPRECEFASMYEAFRATKDCDYGCGRDYSMQAVRLWLVPEMDRIKAAAATRARAEGLREAADALDDHTGCDCEDGDHVKRLATPRWLRLRADSLDPDPSKS